MRTLSCGRHVVSSSLTRDWTWAPCTGSTESYPLCHQGSPMWIFNRWLLSGWGSSLLFLVCWIFYHERELDFVKCRYWIYWDDLMIFAHDSINMMHYIDWYLYVKATLHFWDKSYLTMVYNPFIHCWVQFASIFLNIFAFISIKNIGVQFSFLMMSLPSFVIRVMLVSEWVGKCSLLLNFLEDFVKGLS